MSKTVFMSFADSRYASSLTRLKSETEAFGFDERFFFSEKDLPKDFFKGFSPKLYRRGYGYWIWKPYIVKQILDKIDEGDILVYSDSGNRWCESAISRYNEYLSMLSTDIPLITFQQQHLEKDWTKGDVFQYICPKSWKSYAVTLQIWSGCFLLVKTKETVALIDKWNDIAQNQRQLFTDKASAYPNTGYFQENRHDQSCFSLLAKQMPHIEISWEEVDDLDGKWENFGAYPIQARRARKTKHLLWLKNRVLLRPYRYLQGMYLVVFKHFHFLNKVAWGWFPASYIVSTYLYFSSLGGGKCRAASINLFEYRGGLAA